MVRTMDIMPLCQVELIGTSVFEYVHPGDHQELATHLGLNIGTNKEEGGRQGDRQTINPLLQDGEDML